MKSPVGSSLSLLLLVSTAVSATSVVATSVVATSVVATSVVASEVPLKIGPAARVVAERLPDGEVVLSDLEPGAHFWSSVVPDAFDPGRHRILAFEYFSPSGAPSLSLRYRRRDGEMVLVASRPVPFAETWQPFALDLSGIDRPLERPGEESRFHFSFKVRPGLEMRIRNLRLREASEAEERAAEEREAIAVQREADAEAVLRYLREDRIGWIDRVEIGDESVTIDGRHEAGDGKVRLRELRPTHVSHVDSLPEPPLRRGLEEAFRIGLPRFAGPSRRDRAHSRWRLESESGEGLSAARWGSFADGVAPDRARLAGRSQKGLGGIPMIATPDHEIFELGIHHATVNVVLDGLLSDRPSPGREKILFEGRPYYLNRSFLRARQTTVRHLREKDIVVTAILLVGNRDGSTLTHPEAEPRGIFAMPNLATERGADLYRAALHVLGNHFTRPGTRISNWVIHNEVDQAGTWTNMGDQPLARYLETYHRSARLVHQAMRQRDPHARVFVSLTHHWTKPSLGPGAYTVRDLLERFAEIAATEGEFEWGVAYHPYPKNLRNPDTWLDEKAEMSFETPYITPKNFEVLPFYLQQERFLFEGRPRGILFSEQGFNTPTLSEEDQRRQVAGLVYLFERLPRFPMIEAFHLHRYRDMPDREGGLRLGIMDENGNRKLGWEAYRTMGTEEYRQFEEIAEEVIRSRREK